MTLQRGWLAGEIATRLAAPLALAQMQPTDTAGNLKEPLDDTLRALGVPEDQLAATDLPLDYGAADYIALASYNVLHAVRLKIIGSFDISSEGTSLRLNQRLQNVERLLKEAEARVLGRFGGVIPTGDDASGGIITLDLNYLTTGPARPMSRDIPWTTIGLGDG